MPSYGGQALIEGVLMRGKRHLAAAYRTPDGEIMVEHEPLTGLYTTHWAKLPFLRGIVLLWDAIGLGTKYLSKSANVQGDENEKIEGPTLYLTLAFSFLIGIGIFFVAPALIGKFLQNVLNLNTLAMNLVEGVMRLSIMLVYLWAVGKSKDIQRVFSYHGAEHKTINAFEAGAELIPEKVSGFSLQHPRCGTSFLLTLIIFSIILFSLLGDLNMLQTILTRILLLPVLSMFAYEYQRFTANHMDNPAIKWLMKPNLALQKLTTREPSLDMLEVSIAAFSKMYELENSLPSE